MTTSTARAQWQGDLATGTGEFSLASGTFKGHYSFPSRFEGSAGTNPEELIAAAHAACFSMAFSNQLAKAGFTPTNVATQAAVSLEKIEGGFGITRIVLTCEADVPRITESQFLELAEAAKTGCPVSKALASVPSITLQATLKKAAA